MKIKYLGHSCFQITSNLGTTIITDPYTQVGYELSCGLQANVVTVSHAHFDHNYTDCITKDVVVSTLGKHNVQEIQIEGIHSWHDPRQGALRGENIIYKFLIDGLTICHLGDLGETISNDLINKIGYVDILLLPVGGTYTIDATQAKELVQRLSPKVVIPMHFKPSYGKIDIMGISVFLDQFPQTLVCKDLEDTVEITKENLPNTLQIFHLERQKI